MPRSKVARAAKGVAAVAVAVPLVFLVVLNLALWTGFVEWAVSGKRERSEIRLEHGFAWCVWPTQVHVRDFALSVGTHEWQLYIALERGEVDIALWELLRRRFHARSIEAAGAEIRWVGKTADGDPPEHAPSIPRLGPPRLEGEKPPPRPIDGTWTIDLDHVRGTVRQAWFDEARAELHGVLEGSLFLVLDHALTLGPTRLATPAAYLTVAEQPVVCAAALDLGVRIAPFTFEGVRGREVLRFLSAELLATAQVCDLQWTERYLPASTPVRLRGGEGLFTIEAHLALGRLLPGARSYFRAAALEVGAREQRIRAAVELAATVPEDGATAEVEVRLAEVTARRGGEEEPWVLAPEVTANVAASGLDLARREWPIEDARVEVPQFVARDLSDLPLPPPARFRGGRVRGRVSATRAGDERFEVEAVLDGKEIDLQTGKHRIGLSAYVRAVGMVDAGAKTLVLDPLRAQADQVTVVQGSDLPTTSLEIHRARLELDWGASQLWAKAAGRVRSLVQFLDMTNERDMLLSSFPSLGDDDPTHFQVTVTRPEPRAVEVALEGLRNENLRAEGLLRRVDGRSRGAFLLENLGTGVLLENGDVDVEVLSDEAWLERKRGWVQRLTP